MSFRDSSETEDNRVVAPDPERLASAAFRLKHDLGKAVRWNAPGRRERSTEVLRRRLAKDLLETRTGPDGRARSAVEVFDAWMSEDGALFRSEPGCSTRIARMAEAIGEIRRRLPLLPGLGWEELVTLDEASLVLSEETRALWRETVAVAPASFLP